MNDLLNVANVPKDGSLPERNSVDLSVPGVRKHIAAQILADIDAFCVATYDGGHRKHLGASLVGHECERYLYNVFRWLKHEKFSGRMLRLFNRGHREEARFLEWLRGVGFTVWDIDGEGNQFRVKACQGHFGGSLDGVNQPPARYCMTDPMLCEFKTSGTGAGFNKLKEKGVAVAKPQHFAQMSTYGKFYGFRYALYMCINKNDDDIYIEIVELNYELGEHLVSRAEAVITARTAPPKLAENEAFMTCKYCVFVGICHRGEAPEVNCRSCQNAEPIADGNWYCHLNGGVIPSDFIPQGCSAHRPVQ